MNKEQFNRLDLELITKTLDNGLKVYVVPFNNVNNTYVTFSTNYGSIQNEFIPINKTKMTKYPLGIAHFLEHKLFEQKNGVDPFTFYSERGSDANANTSNFKTTYLFSGTNFLEENLNFLLDYVQEQYFTMENVEKEKGIIEQEINMYQDDPFSKLVEILTLNTFVNHPIKYPVIGDVKSINSITKDDLYECYNTFYNPANMMLVITGNCNETIIEEVINNQKEKHFEKQNKIVVKKYDEPNNVCKKHEVIKMDVQIPKVGVSFKINKDLGFDKIKTDLYFSILFDLLYDSTSIIEEKLKNDGIINDNLGLINIDVDNYGVYMVIGESKEPDILIKKIIEVVNNIKVTEEDLERKKRVYLSSLIIGSDSIYNMNHKIMNNIIKYGKVITNTFDIVKELNIDEFNSLIKKIDFSNNTSCIVNKKYN